MQKHIVTPHATGVRQINQQSKTTERCGWAACEPGVPLRGPGIRAVFSTRRSHGDQYTGHVEGDITLSQTNPDYGQTQCTVFQGSNTIQYVPLNDDNPTT